MPWINLGELDSARKYIEKNTLGLELSHSDDIASHALNYAYQFILGVKENKTGGYFPIRAILRFFVYREIPNGEG